MSVPNRLAPRRIELKADGRLKPLVDVGPDLLQILAGDFLPGPIEVAEDIGLDPAGRDLLLADDRGRWGRDCLGSPPLMRLGLYSIWYERSTSGHAACPGSTCCVVLRRTFTDLGPRSPRSSLCRSAGPRYRHTDLSSILLNVGEVSLVKVGLVPVEISPSRAHL